MRNLIWLYTTHSTSDLVITLVLLIFHPTPLQNGVRRPLKLIKWPNMYPLPLHLAPLGILIMKCIPKKPVISLFQLAQSVSTRHCLDQSQMLDITDLTFLKYFLMDLEICIYLNKIW